MEGAGPLITSLGTAAGAEALKLWGAFGLVLLLLGLFIWYLLSRVSKLQDLVEARDREIKDLQEKRLEDAKKMIGVTESSTQLTTARAEGDKRFAEFMGQLVDEVAQLKDQLAAVVEQPLLLPPPKTPPPKPRRPRSRSPR